MKQHEYQIIQRSDGHWDILKLAPMKMLDKKVSSATTYQTLARVVKNKDTEDYYQIERQDCDSLNWYRFTRKYLTLDAAVYSVTNVVLN